MHKVVSVSSHNYCVHNLMLDLFRTLFGFNAEIFLLLLFSKLVALYGTGICKFLGYTVIILPKMYLASVN